MRSPNLRTDPDVFGPDRRAPREVLPLYMSEQERQDWRERGTLLTEIPHAKGAEAVAIVQRRPRSKRKRPTLAKHFLVAWRTDFDNGVTARKTLPQAEELAGTFDQSRRWAGIIDTRTYLFLDQFGTRFAALGLPARKPMGRVEETQHARRANAGKGRP
jgi:hypothetical protein